MGNPDGGPVGGTGSGRGSSDLGDTGGVFRQLAGGATSALASALVRFETVTNRTSGSGVVPSGVGGPVAERPPSGQDQPDHPVREEVTAELQSAFDDLEPAAFGESKPSTSYLAENFFDFGYLEDHEEIERTWVREPYAYVTVLKSKSEDRRRYRVVEPMLDEFERYVWRDLLKAVRNRLLYENTMTVGSSREEAFIEEVERVIDDHAASIVDTGSLYKLYYYLVRDFARYGPIDAMLQDPKIEDVSCDGIDVPIYVYHFDYRDLRTNVRFDRDQLSSFVLRLANQAGRQVSVSDPLVDGSLPDGSRIQLTFGGDISTRGANFTIRKFASVPYTPVDLIRWGTFSVEQMAYFWLAIENNKSLIFAGGTGSGKTTSLNAVSFFIPEDSKVVSIEDTQEISLPHDNWVQSLARDAISSRGKGEVSTYELLQASLRQRPEYLLVGEIRTDSQVAFTFFQAIGTGHTAYTTLHADSITGVLNRLENDPLNVPTQMIRELDIVSLQKQTHIDGERARRNSGVTEIVSEGEGDDIRIVDVFTRDAKADEYRQVGDSSVLADIADDHGWSTRELREELHRRESVLRYMLDEGIDSYHDVAHMLYAYGRNPELVMARVRNDEGLDPDALVPDRGADR